MKQKTVLFTATILLVVFVTGCSIGVTPGTEVPPPLPMPTQPVAPILVSPLPTFLPVCLDNQACAPLDIQNTEPGNTYCVKKIPYQNFSLQPEAMINSLEPAGSLKCQDSGTVIQEDGKYKGYHIWTCTGEQLQAYKIKITNPACKLRALVIDANKCQAGLKYDAMQNCCTDSTQDPGSATVTVNMGACPP